MKRSGIRRASPLRRRNSLVRRGYKLSEQTDAEHRLFERDGPQCRLMRGRLLGVACFGSVAPHHLRKRSQGGTWQLDNLVGLCAAHNCAVEDEPDLAHELGLVCRNGETLADCWGRIAAAGLGRPKDPAQGAL